MAIPDYQTLMLPLLEALADGRERKLRELLEPLADRFGLSKEEREAILPSGQQTIFNSRLGWARTYLKKAGLLESPVRGFNRITALGRQVLAGRPTTIDNDFLKQYPSFREFVAKSGPKPNGEPVKPEPVLEESQTPFEQIEAAYNSLSAKTADELLERLKACSPAFFEMVVVKLLLAMGYGGVAGEGKVTGRSGDGGIDGVIRQDKLGLDVVCIQAKRWEGSVGRPVIQQFVGGMDGYRAKKGVIMTTSNFSKDALDFVHRIEGKRVVLIDGDRLAALMVEHDLGVTSTKTYVIKEVSNDFFDEEEG